MCRIMIVSGILCQYLLATCSCVYRVEPMLLVQWYECTFIQLLTMVQALHMKNEQFFNHLCKLPLYSLIQLSVYLLPAKFSFIREIVEMAFLSTSTLSNLT